MPYTKQTWTNGDMLTATKLNHMEDGIANAGGGLIVRDTGDTTTITINGSDYSAMPVDHTYQDIKNVLISGGTVSFIISPDEVTWGFLPVYLIAENSANAYPYPPGYPYCVVVYDFSTGHSLGFYAETATSTLMYIEWSTQSLEPGTADTGNGR